MAEITFTVGFAREKCDYCDRPIATIFTFDPCAKRGSTYEDHYLCAAHLNELRTALETAHDLLLEQARLLLEYDKENT